MNLASIQKIHSIQPHPNADSLDTAKIKGWPVVVKKGEYNEEQLVVFVIIDSIVPSTNPYFAFMEKQKYRVWNAKFRGQPSQGLVCPLSILPVKDCVMGFIPYTEGEDVTETLGVKKYERPLDASVMGDAAGGFPTHLISITDEDNLLSYPEALNDFNEEACYATKKQDGSSMTVLWFNGELKVCSRRLELKDNGRSAFWRVVHKYELPRKLKELNRNIAIQAECCGPKMNGNALGLTELDMFVFTIKDLDKAEYQGLDGIRDTALALGLPMVPLVKWWRSFDASIEELQEMANSLTYPNQTPAEGLVLRTDYYKHSPVLNKMCSVKVINQSYK